MIRLRVGVRIPFWFLRNAGIFVIRATPDAAKQITSYMDSIRALIAASGNPEYAAWLVCETA